MALSNPLETFVWGAGGARKTPEEIAREREIAAALMAQGVDTSPVGHWTQGAARVVNALGGVLREKRANKAAGQNAADSQSRIAKLLGGMGGQTSQFPPAPVSGGAQTAAAPPDYASQRVAQAFGDAPASAPVNLSGNKQAFIEALLPAAIEESRRTGVDPRIIVAQAAQETGWGKSAPGNNYFGIKSHGKGGGQNLTTHEVINGQRVKINDSFRSFASPADSVRGYGDFLLDNPRYKGMREAQGLDAQLQALGASGYATDPNYANSVGAIARSIQLPEGGQPMPTMPLGPGSRPSTAPLVGTNPINNRPILDNGDGSYSTEESITVTNPRLNGGRPTNIPSIWNGRRTSSEDEAIAEAMRSGQQFPSFGSIDEAVNAARARSDSLAAGVPGGSQYGGLEMAGNAPQPVQMAQNGNNMQAIIEALSSPYASAQEKDIAGILLQQNMQQNDPMRQLQMEQMRLENEAMKRGPKPSYEVIQDKSTGEIVAVDRNNIAAGPVVVRKGGLPMDAPTTRTIKQADGSEVAVQWNPQTRAWEPMDAPLGGNQVQPLPKLTEQQSKDLVYYQRGEKALADLDKMEGALTSFGDAFKSAIPGVGNALVSNEFQQAQQAARNFLAAVLRKDTGAAITNQEMDIYGKMFLPQPGDSPETLAQKKQARSDALAAIRTGLGAAERALPRKQEPPQGVDPSDWEFMTPEERRLFQ